MTLIAGFRFNDGVLLCSDSQMESVTIKTKEPKICMTKFPGGHAAFTFAGNARKAQSTIYACVKRLRTRKPHEDVFVLLEQVIEIYYRKLVHKDPDYGKDHNLHYDLILAVWIEERKRVFIWSTQDVSLYESTVDYICAGVGLDLGYYMVSPIFSSEMNERETLFLAIYMMARVSDNAQGIGGMSHYLAMHNDGTASPVMEVELNEALKYKVKGWDASAANFLIFSALQEVDEARRFQLLRQVDMVHRDASLF